MVFKKIAECIASTHFQISEKALTLWSSESNECILRPVADNVEVILLQHQYIITVLTINKVFSNVNLFIQLDIMSEAVL